MEACLNAFGYNTRLMMRTDLESRVTAAVVHSIVEVTAQDGVKYIVDPSYIQFYKDISHENAPLPQAPLLVLRQTEVDGYIEKNLMTRWKATIQLSVNPINLLTFMREKKMALLLDNVETPPEMRLGDTTEAWVREALRRVWTLSTYHVDTTNIAFQEIFCGEGKNKRTYDLIKGLGSLL